MFLTCPRNEPLGLSQSRFAVPLHLGAFPLLTRGFSNTVLNNLPFFGRRWSVLWSGPIDFGRDLDITLFNPGKDK